MDILFLGLDKEWVDYAKEIGYKTYLGKVEDFKPSKEYKRIFYVSPANAYLFMDGGIDLVYSRIMFPNIEYKIQSKLKKVNRIKNKYLPIGKAICTKYKKNLYLISAPTMLLPQNVSETKNAYYATIGIFNLLNYHKNLIYQKDSLLIIPQMCCGWGKMDLKESVNQINQAIQECKNGKRIKLNYDQIILEQPNYYCNSEWKYIDPKEIVRI